MRGLIARAFLPACCAAVLPAAAFAQGGYFGQNNVQHHDFKFQVLETEHFDVYFYPAEEEAAKLAGRMAERWDGRCRGC